jgi:O-antigen ligase
VLVFVSFCRLSEFSHGVPFIVIGLSLVVLLCVGLAGNLAGSFKTIPGMMLLGLTLWMFMGVPLSVSPMGAFDVVSDLWVKSATVYFLIVAGAVTFPECRKVMYAAAFASVMINILASRYGYMHGGRLAVGGGTLTNPNDLAMYILTSLPFCVYALYRARGWRKLFWVLTVLASLNYVSKTGSRGALLAIAVASIYVFFKSSMGQKALMGAAIAAAMLAAPIVVPEHIYMRYMTIFSSGASDSGGSEAEGSTQARLDLLKKSVDVTLQNPIFGVGPGMFPLAAFGTMKAHVSHNMYTQLSSETGIPGLLMYLTALGFCLYSTGKLLKRAKKDPSLTEIYRAAFTVRIALMLYMVMSFFGSVAYGVPVMILLGLAEVLRKTATAEIQAATEGAAARRNVVPANPIGSFPRLQQVCAE